MARAVRGTMHQGDASFSLDSAGRQCTAMAAVACCRLLTHDPASWTTADVDASLRSGDALYRESVARRDPGGPANRAEDANRNYVGVAELYTVAPMSDGPIRFVVDVPNTLFGNLTGRDG